MKLKKEIGLPGPVEMIGFMLFVFSGFFLKINIITHIGGIMIVVGCIWNFFIPFYFEMKKIIKPTNR